MKTKYRTINNGYWELLQYEHVYKVTKGFWWWKKEVEKVDWYYVPRPYYDETYGRYDSIGSEKYVNSLKNNLEFFVKEYPDINEYLKMYEEQQALLEAAAQQKNERRRYNKTKVRYFE